MKEFVSVHHRIICTGLKSITRMFISIEIGVHFLKFMNVAQGEKTAVQTFNRLLDAVLKFLKYRNIKIYHAIYIRVFSYETVSYFMVFTNDVTKTPNNEPRVSDLIIFLKNNLI